MTFEVIRIHGIAMGVGTIDHMPEGNYFTSICETFYNTGNDEKDADESEKWANIICNSLNKYHKEI